MYEIQPIESNGQRVLTTVQIAECYGTDSKTVSYNFNHNKDRYTEGKHFYCLTGDEKRELCNRLDFPDGSKASKLYLWTEKGALLHAKSLGTDKAWAVYETLVDTYFEVQQKPKIETDNLSAELQMFGQMFKAMANSEMKLKMLDEIQVEQGKAITEQSKKLDNAIEIFSTAVETDWKKQMNDKINRLCMENKLNYNMVRHDLYAELEFIAKCNLNTRVNNLKSRLRMGGAKYSELQAITKIDVISRDNKLKPIFEGIVQKFQAKYID